MNASRKIILSISSIVFLGIFIFPPWYETNGQYVKQTRALFLFQQAGGGTGRMLFRRMCDGASLLLPRCALLASLGRNAINNRFYCNRAVSVVWNSCGRKFPQHRASED